MSRLRQGLILLAACLAAAGLGIAGTASGEIVRLGNLELEVDGAVKPRKLPAKGRAPISLDVEAAVRTLDGSQPPVLESFLLEFDRNGSIRTKGLPTCDVAELQGTTADQARDRCGKAQVGSGSVAARVALPGRVPFEARGPLLAFNGERQGRKPVIVFHIFAAVPEPTTFVIPAVIGNDRKPFGKRVQIDVPVIAGGSGALTRLAFTLHRTWRQGGKRRSYLVARCRGGHLVAQGRFEFADGSSVTGSVARPCKAKRSKGQRRGGRGGAGRNSR